MLIAARAQAKREHADNIVILTSLLNDIFSVTNLPVREQEDSLLLAGIVLNLSFL